MKKIALAFLLLGAFVTKAQEVKKDTVVESLKETVDAHTEKFNGLDERLSEMSSDLSGLKKLSISGYVQAQYETYDFWNADGSVHGTAPTSGAPAITNSFFLRRARVKFVYKATDGVNFVLCPNFDIDRIEIKDAFVQLNDRWTKTFSLWMGQFSKMTYEIEYSSASREFAERSQMSRTLFPKERDQGAKLEADFRTKYNLPLTLQVAVFNGGFGKGTLTNQIKDVDNTKDVMARAVYSLNLPSKGLGIDLGGLGYFGNNKVISQTATPTVFTDVNNNPFTPKVGDNLKQQWFGGELRAYWDFLGGVQLKSEYMAGTLSTFSSAFPSQSFNFITTNVDKVRNFNGYYVSLIKNIGKDHQIGARLDSFDPNTKLSGDQVSNSADLKYNNWTYSYQYFFNENIKIQLTYNMPINEKTANAALVNTDFANRDKRDNTFTLRVQARF